MGDRALSEGVGPPAQPSPGMWLLLAVPSGITELPLDADHGATQGTKLRAPNLSSKAPPTLFSTDQHLHFHNKETLKPMWEGGESRDHCEMAFLREGLSILTGGMVLGKGWRV